MRGEKTSVILLQTMMAGKRSPPDRWITLSQNIARHLYSQKNKVGKDARESADLLSMSESLSDFVSRTTKQNAKRRSESTDGHEWSTELLYLKTLLKGTALLNSALSPKLTCSPSRDAMRDKTHEQSTRIFHDAPTPSARTYDDEAYEKEIAITSGLRDSRIAEELIPSKAGGFVSREVLRNAPANRSQVCDEWEDEESDGSNDVDSCDEDESDDDDLDDSRLKTTPNESHNPFSEDYVPPMPQRQRNWPTEAKPIVLSSIQNTTASTDRVAATVFEANVSSRSHVLPRVAHKVDHGRSDSLPPVRANETANKPPLAPRAANNNVKVQRRLIWPTTSDEMQNLCEPDTQEERINAINYGLKTIDNIVIAGERIHVVEENEGAFAKQGLQAENMDDDATDIPDLDALLDGPPPVHVAQDLEPFNEKDDYSNLLLSRLRRLEHRIHSKEQGLELLKVGVRSFELMAAYTICEALSREEGTVQVLKGDCESSLDPFNSSFGSRDETSDSSYTSEQETTNSSITSRTSMMNRTGQATFTFATSLSYVSSSSEEDETSNTYSSSEEETTYTYASSSSEEETSNFSSSLEEQYSSRNSRSSFSSSKDDETLPSASPLETVDRYATRDDMRNARFPSFNTTVSDLDLFITPEGRALVEI